MFIKIVSRFTIVGTNITFELLYINVSKSMLLQTMFTFSFVGTEMTTEFTNIRVN